MKEDIARAVPVGIVLFAVFAAVLPAQTTWVVPNGVDLSPYITQAAAGDTLILGATHPGFVLTKGLTLRPATGRTTIANFAIPVGMDSQLQIPTGQKANLQRLDFTNGGWTPWWNGGHPVLVDGVASFEDCTFQSRGPYAIRANSGATALQRCTVTGLADCNPLEVAAGDCSAVDCTFRGSDGHGPLGSSPSHPRPGVVVLGGTFAASHSTFVPGLSAVDPQGYALGPAAGLQVQGGVTRVVECTVSGADWPTGASNPAPNPGGASIRVVGGVAYHARCTLQPGIGTPPGAPTTGNASTDPELVGITSSGALRLGTTWTANGTAGNSPWPFGMALWPDLAPNLVPVVTETVWGDPMWTVLDGWVPMGSGAVWSWSIAIPNSSVFVGARLYAQALHFGTTSLRVSPVVGGVVY
ncbi:MAG: hypothetical protein JNK15_00840 [Planctomycetes bacterium]|nr:hypothetical protein [Planctomycetota bacterium]